MGHPCGEKPRGCLIILNSLAFGYRDVKDSPKEFIRASRVSAQVSGRVLGLQLLAFLVFLSWWLRKRLRTLPLARAALGVSRSVILGACLV